MGSLFEIKLKSILVIENGKFKEDVVGVNALALTLFLPREGVPSVSSVRAFKLKDKEEMNLVHEDIRKRFVMKELVKGDAILEAEITSIDKVSKFKKFMHKMFGVAVDASVGAIPGIGNIVTGLVKAGSESFFEAIEPKDKIDILGKGYMPLNEDTVEGELIIHLSVPKEVKLKKVEIYENGERAYKTITLKKGFTNGKVVLDIKKVK